MESKTLTLRIEAELFAAIEKQSREQDRSYTWTINNLLRRQLASMGLDELKTAIKEN